MKYLLAIVLIGCAQASYAQMPDLLTRLTNEFQNSVTPNEGDLRLSQGWICKNYEMVVDPDYQCRGMSIGSAYNFRFEKFDGEIEAYSMTYDGPELTGHWALINKRSELYLNVTFNKYGFVVFRKNANGDLIGESSNGRSYCGLKMSTVPSKYLSHYIKCTKE